MVLFHFRVHIDNVDLEKLVGFIKSHSTVVLIVREMGERPHIHCILTPTKTPSTFRQQFLKNFVMCKGNKCYSFEEVKEEEHLKAYLCKGEIDIEPDVIFSTMDTLFYHKKYWEVRRELKQSSGNDGKKTKTINLSWLQVCKIDFCKEHGDELLWLQSPTNYIGSYTESEKLRYDSAKKKLLGFILKRLGQNGKLMDDTLIVRFFKTIHNMIIQDGDNPEKFTDYLFDKLNF